MKISIIIPVYNVSKYIVRCIDSVINQTYANIECILVDDCGWDDSIALAERKINDYSGGGAIDFKILYHKYNRGLSAVRNTGTVASTGDYIYYLDSDDEITPDCIETLVALIKKYPDVEMVQGNTQTIPKPTEKKDWRNIHTKNFPEYVDSNQWIYLHFYGTNKRQIPVNAWNKLIKRKFIVDNDLFFKEGILYEDEMWMFYVVKKINSIAFTTKYTYIHYITQGSIMQSDNNYKKIQNTYIILEEVFNNFNDCHFEYFKKKYTRILYKNLCLINLNTSESELEHLYKILVKNIINQSLRKKKILFALPLYILLMPQSFYKSFFIRQFFRLFLKLSV
jgi:glycosyltransferase involved in cell wall biosynthesis